MIYKIMTKTEWMDFQRAGCYRGSTVDLRDGFIHFSGADQVVETAAKHFSGQRDLKLVAVDEHQLGDALRWELSRGGQLFPHLYATIKIDLIESVSEIPVNEEGRHDFAGLL